MRICYISHADSYHTTKWAKYFASRGHEVHIISLRNCESSTFSDLPDVIIHTPLTNKKLSFLPLDKFLDKARYLTAIRSVKSLVRVIEPDIVHAHRASSNGLICALSCKHPYFLSIWGEDIFSFPKRSPLHRAATRFSLRSCTWLLSTSVAMATEAGKYTNKAIEITPFGVNMDLFNPSKRVEHDPSCFVVGTVKALEPRYGIATLLEACSLFRERHPEVLLEIRIAGRGSQEQNLRLLASELGLSDNVVWLGFISQEQASVEWANFDVGVVPSESESFGVSAVECQASGTPLIITEIPGLMEACQGGRTALVVPRQDCKFLADTLDKLYEDSGLREDMGARGRAYVEEAYDIDRCFAYVERLYEGSQKAGQVF